MPSSDIVALIPLRSPGRGKTRLSGALSADERALLSGAMLADVVGALAAAPIDRVAVVASGPAAAAAGSALGVEVLLDPPGRRSLDAALAAAAGRLGGVGTLLVVTADLPRLTPSDVVEVLGAAADVVVAPTADGGTGGLLRRPPDVIRTAYGPGSAARHRHLAARAGVSVDTVAAPGFRHDVDTAGDLAALSDAPVGAATAAALRRLGPAVTGAGRPPVRHPSASPSRARRG